MTSNPAHHKRSKHTDIDIHFIRKLVQSSKLKLIHVKSSHQIAYLLTKPLSHFQTFLSKLGILDLPIPPWGVLQLIINYLVSHELATKSSKYSFQLLSFSLYIFSYLVQTIWWMGHSLFLWTMCAHFNN